MFACNIFYWAFSIKVTLIKIGTQYRQKKGNLPYKVLRAWHCIVAIGGGEVGVEVVHGEVDPHPAQRVGPA